MGEDQVRYLVGYGGVGGCSQAFVQDQDLAKFTYVSVLPIAVAFNCHFEHLAEEIGQIEVFLEPAPKVLQYVALLQPFKDAHHVVKNRSEGVLGWQFANKPVNSELILVKNVIEVQRHYDLTHFGHYLRQRVSSHKVVIEKGQQPFENVALEEGLPPHVPFELEDDPLDNLQGVEHLDVGVGAEVGGIQVGKHDVEVLDQRCLRLVVVIVDIFVVVLPEHHQHVEFLFDPDARGRLEGVKELYQNGLAKDQDGDIQIL